MLTMMLSQASAVSAAGAVDARTVVVVLLVAVQHSVVSHNTAVEPR